MSMVALGEIQMEWKATEQYFAWEEQDMVAGTAQEMEKQVSAETAQESQKEVVL